MPRENEFTISIRFRDTSETFLVNGVTVNMVINDLKVRLELIAGIPKNLQRLMYLDEGGCYIFYTISSNSTYPLWLNMSIQITAKNKLTHSTPAQTSRRIINIIWALSVTGLVCFVHNHSLQTVSKIMACIRLDHVAQCLAEKLWITYFVTLV